MLTRNVPYGHSDCQGAFDSHRPFYDNTVKFDAKDTKAELECQLQAPAIKLHSMQMSISNIVCKTDRPYLLSD